LVRVGQIKTRVKRVEYNVFLFDDPLKGSKLFKIFKINLTFRFDKLSHLSKSVHIGENSQILTSVEQKKIIIGCKFITQIEKQNEIINAMKLLFDTANFQLSVRNERNCF
jgi:hypothetical protein